MKQIEEKVTELLEERERLHGTWQERSDYLRQLLDQQSFLRDTNQLETLSTSQEVHLELQLRSTLYGGIWEKQVLSVVKETCYLMCNFCGDFYSNETATHCSEELTLLKVAKTLFKWRKHTRFPVDKISPRHHTNNIARLLR